MISPSWTYFAFFPFPRRDSHHGAFYLPLALEWKPARWDFLWAFLLANAYLVAIHPVNMLLGTNYGFTVATPAGGSVLDFSRAMALVSAVDAGSGAGADVSAHTPSAVIPGPHGQFPVPPLKGNLSSQPCRFRRNPRKTARPLPEKRAPESSFIV